MRLLLDTHAFLWARVDDPRLSPAVREDIMKAEAVLVSVASAWEAAIKQSLGKLSLPEPFEQGVADSGFDELAIRFGHARLAGALPPHHRDPFDRMLIAQALLEDLTLVTHDRQFKPYGVAVVWL